MPRNVAASVENNFIRGLITEASGLNFPENACTDTYDCNFELTGDVSRRNGFDFETNYATKTIDRTGGVVVTYLWKDVAGNGNLTLLVVQVGETLYFYDAVQSSTVSNGALATTIDLTTYMPVGAPSPSTVECQFSTGNGYLFVTHPTLESFYVSYDSTTSTATAAQISLKIRDFLGISEAVDVENRPAALTSSHHYNLANQGWGTSAYGQYTSSSSITPSVGSHAFTVASLGPWVAGDKIFIWSKSSLQGTVTSFHYMQGVVASYSGTTLTVTVASFGPTSPSALADWQIASEPDYATMFQQTMGVYPSNADVWWDFKNLNEDFDPRSTAAHVDRGGTESPNGHYILDVYNEDRATISGISGPAAVTTGYYRASTSAFFSGRVFYSGISYEGYAGNIYFSQLLKPGATDQFGYCYQRSDPTSEILFDLLPNDGGVISIPEAGTILKLWSMQGGLIAFATNGIWQISGSIGIGFVANDFVVRKIASIRAISASSFVDIGGFPAWWSAEGIYLLQPDSTGSTVTIKSLTDESILTFYKGIPTTCKKQARGYFDLVTKKVQWLFRSTEAGTVEEIYEYDRVLIFNARTASFNPWTISASTVKIHGLFVVDNVAGLLTPNTVIDDATNTVVDDAGNTVVAYSISTSVIAPAFKYLVSYSNAGSYDFTVAGESDTNYTDWVTYDAVGVDYTSYFISGYKVHGNAQRKFQSNYVYIFSKTIPSQYNFQALWDYANTGDSGSWSSQSHQSVVVSDTNYDIKHNRLKVRGQGLTLQFKVYSSAGQPFRIVGWSTWETGNASI